MNWSNFMKGWVAITGSVTMIALILTTFMLMFHMVKPPDAVKHIWAILGFVVVLVLIPCAIVSAWSGLSAWQRFELTVIGIIILLAVRPRQQPRSGQKR